MSKINLEDTAVSAIAKMADGNPGAMGALMEIFKEAGEIDPQAFGGGISPILSLDTLEIYGTDIYVLFNDQCGRDVRRMIMILRAWQLGLFDHDRLRKLAADQMRTEIISEEEWGEIESKVLGQLEEFARQ